MASKPTKASMDGFCATSWRCCHEDPIRPPCLRELVMRIRGSSLCYRRMGTIEFRPKKLSAIEAGDREGPERTARQEGRAFAGTGGIRHASRTSAGSLPTRLLSSLCRSNGESVGREHSPD